MILSTLCVHWCQEGVKRRSRGTAMAKRRRLELLSMARMATEARRGVLGEGNDAPCSPEHNGVRGEAGGGLDTGEFLTGALGGRGGSMKMASHS